MKQQQESIESRVVCTHAVPVDQPNQVHELAARILDVYQVLGGRAHLAGCTLDEVPVVRISTRDAQRIDVIFGQANPEGRLVDAELSAILGLEDVTDSEAPSSIPPKEIARLVAQAQKVAENVESIADQAANVTVIWCKYARGKIQFTISDAVAQQAFAGWARNLTAPKFHCQVTDTESMRVAVTSDGRIVAADELEDCEVSGQRLPRCELVRCAASGRLVSADLVVRCPVSQDSVLESELATCPVCQQRVSPNAVESGRCGACRRLTTVRLDDPRLVQILARFPQLTNWKWLRLAESESVIILTAAGLFERRLIVVDRVSGQLLHAARRTRLAGDWTALTEAELLESL